MSIGWRRLIGCLQLQVIFRKRATNHGPLLQEMTYKDEASYESSPLCTVNSSLPRSCQMAIELTFENVPMTNV